MVQPNLLLIGRSLAAKDTFSLRRGILTQGAELRVQVTKSKEKPICECPWLIGAILPGGQRQSNHICCGEFIKYLRSGGVPLYLRAFVPSTSIGVSVSDSSGGKHDKQFFDTFMLIIGALILIAFAIYFGAKAISANTQEAEATRDPMVQKAVSERIKPVGQVAVSGADNSALEEKSAAPVALADVPGDQLYTSTCSACHAAGVLNAPKIGDKGAWAPRIAQGKDTLYKHALQGFNSMPAKGGAATVSDKSVTDAVDYMVSKAK